MMNFDINEENHKLSSYNYDNNNYKEDEINLEDVNNHTDRQFITVMPIEKEAPNSTLWYHGKIDRFECEEKLKTSGLLQSFLVRESEKRPGSFVLSYMARDGSINHYKITAVFGDYYIGGRQFDRLETLISYYMFYSELKKGECLLHPMPPTKICRLERYCVALNSHTKSLDSDELSFNKNDYLKVYHQISEGDWLWAQLIRTNEYGLVSADLMHDLEDSKLHELEPWFFKDLTKEEAANTLAEAGQCSFLVRPSEQSPGDFTLFFNVNNFVHRFRISCNDNKFYIGGRTFDSILSIIERYKHEDLIEGYRLVISKSFKKQRATLANTSSSIGLTRNYSIDSFLPLDNFVSETEQNFLNIQRENDAQEMLTKDLLLSKTRNFMSTEEQDEKVVTISIKKTSSSDFKRNSIGPDILNRKTDQVENRGYLHKYNDKTKKWKPYWFVLNETERHLFYFANEKRIKEKGLIDLNYGCYYPVDESLFSKNYCFQIVVQQLGSSITTTYYLQVDDINDFKSWSNKVRALCKPSQKLIDTQNYEISQSLYIEIKEARNIFYLLSTNKHGKSSDSSSTNTRHSSPPLFKDTSSQRDYFYYCLVLFNNDVYTACTKLINNMHTSTLNVSREDTIWDEAFTFNNVPLDVHQIKLLIYSTKRRSLTQSLNTKDTSSSTPSSGYLGSKALSTTSLTHSFTQFKSLKFKSTNQLIGSLTIRLDNRMLNRGLYETWFKPDSSGTSDQNYCSLRIKIRLNEDRILNNIHEYSHLTSYLFDSYKYLSMIYDSICPSNERSELVENLINFYKLNDRILDVLKYYLDLDIDKCCDKNTLFRSTTLTTSLMDYYMRSKCVNYLKKALYEPLFRLLYDINRDHKSFELDPNKLQQDVHEQIQQNLMSFKQALALLLTSIFDLAQNDFPLELVYLFSYIRKRVTTKWPNDKHIKIYCVSSFLFLRLICPSLLNLLNTNSLKQLLKVYQMNTNENDSFLKFYYTFKSSHLLNERHIKLLAKVIQTLANLTECKEAFMLPLSDFLNQNKPLIVKFIDSISTLNDQQLVQSHAKFKEDLSNNDFDTNVADYALRKHLAQLHRVFNSFSDHMNTCIDNLINNDDDADADGSGCSSTSGINRSLVHNLKNLQFILNAINFKTNINLIT